MPMLPMIMRSLGATVPLSPSAEAGTWTGKASAVAAREVRARNPRRLSGVVLPALICLMFALRAVTGNLETDQYRMSLPRAGDHAKTPRKREQHRSGHDGCPRL